MQWTTLGVEHAGAIQRFNYVSASCPTVGLSSKQGVCEQFESSRRLVQPVSVRDLPRDEAERRHDATDATDAGNEAEPLEVGERGEWEPDGLRLSKFSDRTCFCRPFSDVGA